MRMFALALCGLLTLSTTAAADPIVNINSRGQSIRVVLLKPRTAAVGSVILLAGGNGRLDITAAGEITKLTGNQLVRTRAKYRAIAAARAEPPTRWQNWPMPAGRMR